MSTWTSCSPGPGLPPEALAEPKARLSIPLVVELVERARSLTGEPALGFLLGVQARISMHGYLGFAALSAATMREALAIGIQFAPIVRTAIVLRVRGDGRDASVIVEEHADFVSARDVVLPAVLVGL